MPTDIITRLQQQLAAAADPEFQTRQQHYSKEKIDSLGVKTGTVRAIAKAFEPEIKALPLEECLNHCTQLLAHGIAEYRCAALQWAFARRKELKTNHYALLEEWLRDHVHNWADCDQLCCEVFVDFMMRHPSFFQNVLTWAQSQNRWERRAAAVILIKELRKKGDTLPLLFQVAEILLPDPDDLVQKGYGWALKEATETHLDRTLPWIMSHKAQMPRTALRYAIEKLPEPQRQAALSR
ncbi:MAG: DNA alkylation repair protein [Bacteroidia bacterium]